MKAYGIVYTHIYCALESITLSYQKPVGTSIYFINRKINFSVISLCKSGSDRGLLLVIIEDLLVGCAPYMGNLHIKSNPHMSLVGGGGA